MYRQPPALATVPDGTSCSTPATATRSPRAPRWARSRSRTTSSRTCWATDSVTVRTCGSPGTGGGPGVPVGGVVCSPDGAVGSGPGGGAVGGHLDPPPAFVDEVVVLLAERDQVVEQGRALLRVPDDVVCLALGDRDVCSRGGRRSSTSPPTPRRCARLGVRISASRRTEPSGSTMTARTIASHRNRCIVDTGMGVPSSSSHSGDVSCRAGSSSTVLASVVDRHLGDTDTGALALDDGEPGEDLQLFERDLRVGRVLLELCEFRFDDLGHGAVAERVELEQGALHPGVGLGPFLHARRGLLAGQLLGVGARPVPGADVSDDVLGLAFEVPRRRRRGGVGQFAAAGRRPRRVRRRSGPSSTSRGRRRARRTRHRMQRRVEHRHRRAGTVAFLGGFRVTRRAGRVEDRLEPALSAILRLQLVATAGATHRVVRGERTNRCDQRAAAGEARHDQRPPARSPTARSRARTPPRSSCTQSIRQYRQRRTYVCEQSVRNQQGFSARLTSA